MWILLVIVQDHTHISHSKYVNQSGILDMLKDKIDNKRMGVGFPHPNHWVGYSSMLEYLRNEQYEILIG